jgi:hypothetical protein
VSAFEIANRRISEVIGLAVIESWLEAGAGHPHAEAVRIVIAAGLGVLASIVGRRPGAGPYDQRVLQHAALFEIDQQG